MLKTDKYSSVLEKTGCLCMSESRGIDYKHWIRRKNRPFRQCSWERDLWPTTSTAEPDGRARGRIGSRSSPITNYYWRVAFCCRFNKEKHPNPSDPGKSIKLFLLRFALVTGLPLCPSRTRSRPSWCRPRGRRRSCPRTSIRRCTLPRRGRPDRRGRKVPYRTQRRTRCGGSRRCSRSDNKDPHWDWKRWKLNEVKLSKCFKDPFLNWP
jgi:hypothetical protein